MPEVNEEYRYPNCESPADCMPDHLVDQELQRVEAAKFKPAFHPVEDNEPALISNAPRTLERIELLEYQVLHERAHKNELLYAEAMRRLQELQNARSKNLEEFSKLLDGLGAKYNVDFHQFQITSEGLIVPNTKV